MSTYLSLHYHIVFSTKGRRPTISDAWITQFHEYLGGPAKGLKAFPQGVGGVADHVHRLVGLPATVSLSDFMRELKKASSAWVHDVVGVRDFTWQEGYSAFSVSATARESVRAYIANQAEHHRKKSFRDELLEMLERAGVSVDMKYFD